MIKNDDVNWNVCHELVAEDSSNPMNRENSTSLA
jgi:hypothetical protein